ncbi:hypothetical protein TNCV_5073801 [Trichonephila clavipes]|nr:hypothetical protein TNCV_5073801 [Trichonephila clavipes]
MLAQFLDWDAPSSAKADQLWQCVEAAWTAVPQGYIQSIFDSMPRLGYINYFQSARSNFFLKGLSIIISHH